MYTQLKTETFIWNILAYGDASSKMKSVLESVINYLVPR
jgi:hypothetical protein